MTADPLIGKVLLGRHRVIRELAKGGMGAVYLGRTEGAAGFTRPVVIKRILPGLMAEPETAKMFAREARILSNLRHPGIVSVLDFGKEKSAHIMVLEYVHGYDIARWGSYLQQIGRAVEVDHALHVMARVLDALHHAHDAKRSDGTPLRIVHRDVSPTNILIDVDGYVKIVDFGIARVTGDASEYKTQEHSFKGKIGYAAPELLHGAEPSPSADTYSAAIVLYQMLTARHPFRGHTVTDTVTSILTVTPPPLHELRPDVPPRLSDIVQRAMAKKADDRFASAQDLAAALRDVLSQSDDRARQSLLATIQEDFRDDRIAKVMDFEPLSELDAAWRQATDISSMPVPSVSPQSMPTKRPGKPGQPSQASLGARAAGRSGLMLAVSASALVLAIALVGVALLVRPSASTPGNRYVVVEKESPSASTPPSPASATLSDTAAPAKRGETAGVEAERTPGLANTAGPDRPGTPTQTKAGVDAAALTRTFSHHMGPVRSCLSTHREALASTPRMSILFSIDTQGRVTKATLSPASLQATDVGQCVIRAAAGIPFGPQPEPASFGIPITMGFK